MKENEPDKPRLSAAAIMFGLKSAYRQKQEYIDRSRALRTWFIAYGVGFPAVLIANNNVFEKVSTSYIFPYIGILFLLGVSIQIIGALAYKTVSLMVLRELVYDIPSIKVKPEVEAKKNEKWPWTAYMLDSFGHWRADWLTLLCFLIATILAGGVASGWIAP